MKLAITTYATKSYCYACAAQAPRIVAALRYAEIDPKDVLFVFAGDASKEVKAAFGEHESRLKRMGATCELVKMSVSDGNNKPHVKNSNIVIAQLQEAAFDVARIEGCDQLWSVESDILPAPNTLKTLIDVLAIDHGWYSVAAATYPNESFIGGRGTPWKWILENVRLKERAIPPEFQHRLRPVVAGLGWRNRAAEHELKAQALKEAETFPPLGNVWALNGREWCQRGWLESAYPGIGQGAIVPTEWVGLGCTLLSRRALDLANWIGYDGGCTQDLWLCWRAWHPAGLRIVTATHGICSHVKLQTAPDGSKTPVIHHATHELGGECNGHLRTSKRPWNGL